MDDILEVIKSRRTIRSFAPKFVRWELIAKVIDAARHAPSCGNLQNWKFIVVIEPGGKEVLAKLANEQYDLTAAGALIVVCGEPDKAERYYGMRGERLYTIQNCAAAMENMLLEAHSLGLGGRWIGAFDESEVQALLRIPEEVRVQAIIAIGYPKEIPPRPPKYPLEHMVYFGRWRGRYRDIDKYMHDISNIMERKFRAIGAAAKGAATSIAEGTKEKIKETLEKKE